MKLWIGRLGRIYWHRYFIQLIPYDPFFRRYSEEKLFSVRRKKFLHLYGFRKKLVYGTLNIEKETVLERQATRFLKKRKKSLPGWLDYKKLTHLERLRCFNIRGFGAGRLPILESDFWIRKSLSPIKLHSDVVGGRWVRFQSAIVHNLNLVFMFISYKFFTPQVIRRLPTFFQGKELVRDEYEMVYWNFKNHNSVFYPSFLNYFRPEHYLLHNVYTRQRSIPLLLPLFRNSKIGFRWVNAQDPSDVVNRNFTARTALRIDSTYVLRLWKKGSVQVAFDNSRFYLSRGLFSKPEFLGVMVWLGGFYNAMQSFVHSLVSLNTEGVFRIGLPISFLDGPNSGLLYFPIYENEDSVTLTLIGTVMAGFLSTLRVVAHNVLLSDNRLIMNFFWQIVFPLSEKTKFLDKMRIPFFIFFLFYKYRSAFFFNLISFFSKVPLVTLFYNNVVLGDEIVLMSYAEAVLQPYSLWFNTQMPVLRKRKLVSPSKSFFFSSVDMKSNRLNLYSFSITCLSPIKYGRRKYWGWISRFFDIKRCVIDYNKILFFQVDGQCTIMIESRGLYNFFIEEKLKYIERFRVNRLVVVLSLNFLLLKILQLKELSRGEHIGTFFYSKMFDKLRLKYQRLKTASFKKKSGYWSLPLWQRFGISVESSKLAARLFFLKLRHNLRHNKIINLTFVAAEFDFFPFQGPGLLINQSVLSVNFLEITNSYFQNWKKLQEVFYTKRGINYFLSDKRVAQFVLNVGSIFKKSITRAQISQFCAVLNGVENFFYLAFDLVRGGRQDVILFNFNRLKAFLLKPMDQEIKLTSLLLFSRLYLCRLRHNNLFWGGVDGRSTEKRVSIFLVYLGSTINGIKKSISYYNKKNLQKQSMSELSNIGGFKEEYVVPQVAFNYPFLEFDGWVSEVEQYSFASQYALFKNEINRYKLFHYRGQSSNFVSNLLLHSSMPYKKFRRFKKHQFSRFLRKILKSRVRNARFNKAIRRHTSYRFKWSPIPVLWWWRKNLVRITGRHRVGGLGFSFYDSILAGVKKNLYATILKSGFLRIKFDRINIKSSKRIEALNTYRTTFVNFMKKNDFFHMRKKNYFGKLQTASLFSRLFYFMNMFSSVVFKKFTSYDDILDSFFKWYQRRFPYDFEELSWLKQGWLRRHLMRLRILLHIYKVCFSRYHNFNFAVFINKMILLRRFNRKFDYRFYDSKLRDLFLDKLSLLKLKRPKLSVGFMSRYILRYVPNVEILPYRRNRVVGFEQASLSEAVARFKIKRYSCFNKKKQYEKIMIFSWLQYIRKTKQIKKKLSFLPYLAEISLCDGVQQDVVRRNKCYSEVPYNLSTCATQKYFKKAGKHVFIKPNSIKFFKNMNKFFNLRFFARFFLRRLAPLEGFIKQFESFKIGWFFKQQRTLLSFFLFRQKNGIYGVNLRKRAELSVYKKNTYILYKQIIQTQFAKSFLGMGGGIKHVLLRLRGGALKFPFWKYKKYICKKYKSGFFIDVLELYIRNWLINIFNNKAAIGICKKKQMLKINADTDKMSKIGNYILGLNKFELFQLVCILNYIGVKNIEKLGSLVSFLYVKNFKISSFFQKIYRRWLYYYYLLQNAVEKARISKKRHVFAKNVSIRDEMDLFGNFFLAGGSNICSKNIVSSRELDFIKTVLVKLMYFSNNKINMLKFQTMVSAPNVVVLREKRKVMKQALYYYLYNKNIYYWYRGFKNRKYRILRFLNLFIKVRNQINIKLFFYKFFCISEQVCGSGFFYTPIWKNLQKWIGNKSNLELVGRKISVTTRNKIWYKNIGACADLDYYKQSKQLLQTFKITFKITKKKRLFETSLVGRINGVLPEIRALFEQFFKSFAYSLLRIRSLKKNVIIRRFLFTWFKYRNPAMLSVLFTIVGNFALMRYRWRVDGFLILKTLRYHLARFCLLEKMLLSVDKKSFKKIYKPVINVCLKFYEKRLVNSLSKNANKWKK